MDIVTSAQQNKRVVCNITLLDDCSFITCVYPMFIETGT